MKKIDKINHKWITIGLAMISILLSFWGILVSEFKIYSLGIPCSYYKEWNAVAKNISYSIIGGWILFFLTSILPNWVDYNKHQKIIKSQLFDLNLEFSNFMKHANTQGQVVTMINIKNDNHKEELVSSSCICCVLKDLNWNNDYSKSDNISYKKQLVTIVDKIESILSMLSLQYGKYFNDNQLICINQILEIPLKNNWAVDKLGDLAKREDLVNLALEVGYPLQKSIGIPFVNYFK